MPSFPTFDHASAAPRHAAPALPCAIVVATQGRGRDLAEALIRAQFARAYAARITHFMPCLLALQAPDSEPLAALGLREASCHTLFLERYLDQPIEDAIAAQVTRPVERHRIVELGQFAGTGAGAFRTLIQLLTERLHRDGHHWVVFTGTAALRNAFSRLGLQIHELGPADPMRLGADEQDHWGTYYRHSPRVMFGDIGAGFAALAARPAREAHA